MPRPPQLAPLDVEEQRLYFTVPFECWDSAPILRLHLCVKVSEAARGEIFPSADMPLEVVSEVQYWRTRPV